MILMNFKKLNSGKTNYIIKDNDDKLIAFSIDQNGIQSFESDIYNIVINGLRYNKYCIKIAKYQDYDVYFNPISNCKHYLKDGKEDLLMFYLKNGEDATLYKNNKKEFLTQAKKILCYGMIAVNLYIGSLMLIYSGVNIIYNKSNVEIPQYVADSFSGEEVTTDELIDLINNSNNVTENDKKIMINQELFDKLVPYYNNSDMKNIIRTKLKDITIKYETLEGAMGCYNSLEPNIIHLEEELKKYIENDNYNIDYQEDVLAHEFIHVLQSVFSKYLYLKEATAELISHEFLGVWDDGYEKGVKNLKLLIDIIGPEPILKDVFEGDSRCFDEILSNYLDDNQRTEIITYLTKNPAKLSEDENNKFKEILCNLYKNIYEQDIKEDKNIQYEFLYSDNYKIFSDLKSYIKEKEDEVEYLIIDISDKNKVDLARNGILNIKNTYILQKEIKYEEYIKIKNENNNVEEVYGYKIVYNYDNLNRIIEDKKIIANHINCEEVLEKTLNITLDEAVKMRYIVPYYQKTILQEEYNTIEEGWGISNTGFIFETAEDNMRYDKDKEHLIIKIPSIKQRFNKNSETKINM